MNPRERDDFPMTVVHARQLLAAGQPNDAAALLHHHLQHIDPEHAPADEALYEAALLLSEIGASPSWARYAIRVRHIVRPPGQTRRTVLSSTASNDIGGGTDATRADDNNRQIGELFPAAAVHTALTGMKTARTLHGHQQCGEAIRAATRALTAWASSELGSSHPALGAEMIVPLAAMLSACGRDDEAHTVIADHAGHLDPPDSPARYAFADDALHAIDALVDAHTPICLRLRPPDSHPGLRNLAAATGPVLPWADRRDELWDLLLTATSPA
ncbi:hypothetical protein [Winogradskya humida]|uniref:Tetratricopeptide repeat protein n=1 Tax=Winogradskya humida TaxID=113566 RepID=A0ABQ4A1R9_9ACTN|nr:hypothetical protein [Actinoplanes humidus]GIE24799.1 hypothetical protein Ahu01nite_079010 [Actinoplanes humidus]